MGDWALNRPSWRRLVVGCVTSQRGAAIGIVLLGLVGTCLEMGFPLILQEAIDSIATNSEPTRGIPFALTMAVLALGIALTHGWSLVLESNLIASATLAIRTALFAATQAATLGYLSRTSSGALSYRVTSDVTRFSDSLVEFLAASFFDLLIAIGATAALMRVSVGLGTGLLALMLVTGVITHWVGRPLFTLSRAKQVLSARMAGRLQESLSAAKTVRALNGEASELRQLGKLSLDFFRNQRITGYRRAVVVPLWHFSIGLGIVAVLVFGHRMIAEGKLTIGGLVATIAFLEILAEPMRNVGHYYEEFLNLRSLAKRIASLLAIPTVPTGGDTSPGPSILTRFHEVSFAHPGRSAVLDSVSFDLPEYCCTVLIGRTGAGKSTLLDLLLRFYEPDRGTITVGGADLRDLDLREWRKRVGYMPQETVLFRGTLEENIAFGLDVDRERAMAACREAGTLDLLDRLPDGLQSVIGERGATLSGGERQLIGLARLFYRKPDLILLDEPSAALDGEIVHRIHAAIERLKVNRTILLVTHRAATLMLADQVVVLDAGRIVVAGSLSELRNSDPLIAKLYDEAE